MTFQHPHSVEYKIGSLVLTRLINRNLATSDPQQRLFHFLVFGWIQPRLDNGCQPMKELLSIVTLFKSKLRVIQILLALVQLHVIYLMHS